MITISIDNVNNNETNMKPSEGNYIFRIVNTIHRPEKEAVIIEFDIDEGEYKDYYSDLNSKFGFWALSDYRSYKGGAVKYFADFVHALEASNPGYEWDQDETKWHGLKIAGHLYHDEYTGNNGMPKKRERIDKFFPVSEIPKTPEAVNKSAFVDVDVNDVPF